MTTTSTIRTAEDHSTNRILHGDCIEAMRWMPAQSVDFILTDPPYLVNYRDRTGRTLPNDRDSNWLKPAMAAAYRVLKQNRLMVCFYGWPRADDFLDAWRSAGCGWLRGPLLCGSWWWLSWFRSPFSAHVFEALRAHWAKPCKGPGSPGQRSLFGKATERNLVVVLCGKFVWGGTGKAETCRAAGRRVLTRSSA